MFRKLVPFACAMSAWLALGLGNASSQTPIVRIEEDWELKLSQPEPELDAPQITMEMSPFGDDSDLLLQIDFNHATYPQFAKGGYQVRAGIGANWLGSVRHFDGQSLINDSETVSWTQAVQQTESGFVFGISGGSSISWGPIGGADTFVSFSFGDAGSSSLASYTPEDSVVQSGIIYAKNRVQWLRLKRVRLFDADGNVAEYTLDVDAQ